MSTQTSALPDGTTLTKPASGEKVSLSVINTNTDNIANNIIALNGYVNAHWFGNNTLSSIQSALFSFAQSMPDGGSRVIEFGISQATGNFGATNYIGKIERISASRLCVTVMNAMYATNMIIGNYKDGAWNWAEVALTSQINTLSSQLGESKIYRISKTVTIPAGNTTTPGELEVDFASDIGNSSIWAVMCTLNSSVLPYVNNAGAVKTWIKLLSGSPTTKILIYNTDSAWTNYTLYAVLICRN